MRSGPRRGNKTILLEWKVNRRGRLVTLVGMMRFPRWSTERQHFSDAGTFRGTGNPASSRCHHFPVHRATQEVHSHHIHGIPSHCLSRIPMTVTNNSGWTQHPHSRPGFPLEPTWHFKGATTWYGGSTISLILLLKFIYIPDAEGTAKVLRPNVPSHIVNSRRKELKVQSVICGMSLDQRS